ncbi:P-loop containing nucleoside triphosphate hydrolase protein [Trichoderma sp. SZMC 28012]
MSTIHTYVANHGTTEGVAELFKKPLFQITCGDLGTTASDVEKALETHFSLANRWGCILLLDEADVFLAARSPQDFKRNGLVAVFLRVLEYYAGVLFLTTNRIGDFDEAFASRVHISLHYPQLDLESTVKVFELNLDLISRRFKEKNRDIVIERDKIVNFAEESWQKQKKMRWNGRQIRNACQTALALAEFDAQGGNHETIIDKHAKVELTLKHLQTVGVAYRDFIKYLEDVYDNDSEWIAKAMRIRAREEKMKVKTIDPARASGKKEEDAGHDGNEWETDAGDSEVRNEGKGEAGAKTGPDVPSTQAPGEVHGMPPQGYYPYQGMYHPPPATAPQYAPPGAGGQVPPPGQYWNWGPYPGYGQPQGPPPGPPPGPTPTHR